MEQRDRIGWPQVWLVAILLAFSFLAGLLYLAIEMGSVEAIVILTVIATVTLIIVGAGIVMLVNHIASSKQRQEFIDNAQQDMMLLQAQQKAINEQIRGHSMLTKGVQYENIELRKQLNIGKPAEEEQYGLLTVDGVFDELGE